MTPLTKKRLTNAGLFTTAALGVFGFFGPKAMNASVAAVDKRYVHADTFLAFRHALEDKALRDSLNALHDASDLRAFVSRVDSAVKETRRCLRHREACE